MKYGTGTPDGPRVSEPVQVYLKPSDQDRLRRLTEELETNKSDVLRRGLAALERQLTDPRDHPALRVIGLGASCARDPAAPLEGEGEHDAAREHDRFLADSETAAWEASREPDDG